MKKKQEQQQSQCHIDINVLTESARTLIEERLKPSRQHKSLRCTALDLGILEGALVWLARTTADIPALAGINSLYQSAAATFNTARNNPSKLEPFSNELLASMEFCVQAPESRSDDRTLTDKYIQTHARIADNLAGTRADGFPEAGRDIINLVAKHLNAPNLITRMELIRKSAIASEKQERETADAALTSLYWDTAEKILAEKLTGNDHERFSFSLEERLLIDYGLLDCPEKGSPNSVVAITGETIELAVPQDCPVHIMSLTDFLVSSNDEQLDLPRKQSLRDMVDATQTELGHIKERLAQLRNARESLQAQTADNEKLQEIDNKIQHVNWLMLELQHETVRGIINPDDRQKLSQYKKQLVQLRTAKEYILTDLVRTGADKAIMDIDNNIFQLSSVFMKLGYDLYELIDMLDDDDKTRKEYIRDKRLPGMLKEPKHLNTITQMLARHSGLQYCPKLSQHTKVPGIKEFAHVLADMEKYDPNIFISPLIERKGRPRLVLLPGAGNGLYDWKTHAFFVPLAPVKDVQHSVLSAAAEWRIDADEEKKMKEDYLKTAKAPENTSTRAYRESFTGHYIAWITLEAQGFQALPAHIRKWFQANIGTNIADQPQS